MPFAQTSRRLRAVAYTTGKAFQLADYFSNLLIIGSSAPFNCSFHCTASSILGRLCGKLDGIESGRFPESGGKKIPKFPTFSTAYRVGFTDRGFGRHSYYRATEKCVLDFHRDR